MVRRGGGGEEEGWGQTVTAVTAVVQGEVGPVSWLLEIELQTEVLVVMLMNKKFTFLAEFFNYLCYYVLFQ